jgi:hypothetical protein
MNTEMLKIVRPDMKGRIALGVLAKDISSFAIIQEGDRIILIPYVEVLAKEKWLFNNKAALSQVKQGLKDSANKKVRSLGSFKKYLNKKID